MIEGLEGCESLERLDLTLNFIADITCVQRLTANPFLQSIHLTGNPCTQLEGYRSYVVHVLPQLKDLDGSEIIKGERIVARQEEKGVMDQATAEAVRFREEERLKREMLEKGMDPFPPKFNEKGERVYGHSPEERLQMLREQEEMEKEKKKAQEPAPGSISALHQELHKKQPRLTPEQELEKYGRYLMRNEAKIPFHMDLDDKTNFVLTAKPGKFISTSVLNVEVDVNVVRVYVKEALLQVPVEEDLSPDGVQVQRSQTTGELKITVPYAERGNVKRFGKGSQDVKKDDPEPSSKSNDKKALLFPGDVGYEGGADKESKTLQDID
ncbi:U2 small nuclear ribonucleoprotein A' [Angomonas deanei]|uniref:U2A'/phosphoprotein 32 family A C-terminal domain-containing protein n=1 Tax=Angomonas deanei TaxID=59799 RepID=A0A7G2CI20_9TRYP|nr:U2 small nuclear ribonucleoprotein A' [Angomonas deanei]CAD2218611.1 hypothetical protein, conserved [Angomonas deanei]|eukprot:EPY40027.1 U2 small nuclear ribonucleoprotein A' [Angomonas deanei]